MRKTMLLTALAILLAIPMQSQTDPNWHWNFGIGYPFPLGKTSDAASGVFGMTVGANKAINPKLAMRFDGDWNRFNPSSAVKQAYQAEGGYANVWSLSADLQYTLTESGRNKSYIFGGVGTHYKQIYLTNPGIGWACDPWWGICAPVGTDVITDKKTDTAFGANAGIGMQWPLLSGSEFYVEGKYQWVSGNNADVQFIPLTIGWRW